MKDNKCSGKTASPSGTSEIAAPALTATKKSKTERSKLNHPFRDARGVGCEKDVGEIIIYHRTAGSSLDCCGRSSAKVITAKRQRSHRRLIDEVDGIHRALVMKRTAQLVIKLMTRDQRAKRALTTNLLEPRTGTSASTGT